MDAVEGFLTVNETDIHVEACVPFDRLLNDVSQHEDLLYCLPTTSKTCLLFPHLIINSPSYSLDNYFPHHLCSCRHQSDSSPVATVSQVSFLGNLTINPLHQSSGILSSSQIKLSRSCKTSTVVPMSAF